MRTSAALYGRGGRIRVPEMNALFHQEELVDALVNAFPEGLRLAKGTHGRALKLQRNAGTALRCLRMLRSFGVAVQILVQVGMEL